MKKIIYILILTSLQTVYGASNDSIDLSTNIDFACEISWDAEPVASNLDLTSSQTHLLIGRLILKANADTTLTYDVPNEEKLIHNTVGTNHFSLDSVYFENNRSVSGTVSFPISSAYPLGLDPSGTGIDFWQDHYLNYTGVPALNLIQGTYSATWYNSCGPVI